MPPRSRPDNPQSADDQNADNLAFNTSSSQFFDRFSSALDSLVAANPNLDKGQLTRMMAGALNTVTNSKDFSTSIVGSTYDMAFLRDSRLQTGTNPGGTVGVALAGTTRNEDLAGATEDFKNSMQTARFIQQGAAKLGSDAGKDEMRRFMGDVKSDLANLKFTAF